MNGRLLAATLVVLTAAWLPGAARALDPPRPAPSAGRWGPIRLGDDGARVRAILRRWRVSFEDETRRAIIAGSVGPGGEVGPSGCVERTSIRFERDGWRVGIELEWGRVTRVRLAARGGHDRAAIDAFVAALRRRLGPAYFEQPIVTDSYAPLATWMSDGARLAVMTWPDGAGWGVVIEITGPPSGG